MPGGEGQREKRHELDAENERVALFLDMLAAERGASPNTLAAYRSDLERFVAFLARSGASLTTAKPFLIGAFLRDAAEAGLAPASRARRLSAVRQLFKFLVAE